MSNAFYKVPVPVNEPVLNYAPGSPERIELKATLDALYRQEVDVPMYIGGKEVRTGNRVAMHPPHDHQHVLGHYHRGDVRQVEMAIEAALAARSKWAAMPWQERAAIFLRAADLLCGPWRQRMNAATMLAQSKNAYQSEIDAVCELADFWRFNVAYMTQIYAEQPDYSPRGTWNRLEYRPPPSRY